MSSLKRAWSRRREVVLKRDSRRCRRCGSAGALEIHHVVGSLRLDLRRKELSDVAVLLTLCRTCHSKHHHPPDPERAKWRAYVEAME